MSRRRVLALPLVLLTMLMAASPAAAADWNTYHHDASRDGLDSQDPTFASASLNQTSVTLQGAIYAEPLVFGSTVFVATEANVVYALDATTLKVLWSTGQVDPPVPLTEVRNAAGLGGCGNIDPLGMTGTPVIDPSLGAAGTLFVAEETWDANVSTPNIFHKLVKVDLSTHLVTRSSADPPGLPSRGSSSTTNTALEQQRSALALAGGRVIVPYGGLAGDCGAYHGYAVSANESDLSIAGSYQTVPTHTGAGLWAPSGAAVDGSGSVYLASGNGGDNSSREDSEAVIKLDSGMNRLDIWAPSNWMSLNTSDTDIGSVGPMLLPGGLLFQTGKGGVGYLLHQSALSASQNHIGGEAFSAQVCHATSDASFGGTAYANGVIYVPCRDGLAALQLDAIHATFSLLWYDTTARAQAPIVAGGAAWTIMNGTLTALAPSNHAHLFAAPIPGSGQNLFMTPSAGAGQVFIAGNTGGGGAITSVQMKPPPRAGVAGTVGTDDALWAFDGSTRQFTRIGGTLIAAPAVAEATAGAGVTPLFVGTGINHDLYVTDGKLGWAPLTTSPVYCLDNPAAVTQGIRGSGTLTVACTGSDKSLWYAQGSLPASGLPLIAITNWRRLGGLLLAGPALAYKPGSTIPTFEVLGTNSGVWEMTLGAPGFTRTAWDCVGHPAIATNPGGTTTYFACQGTDRQLWYATTSGGSWSSAAPAGGVLVDGPGIATTAGGATFYVEGTDSELFEISLNGATLSGYLADGGVIHFGAGASRLQ